MQKLTGLCLLLMLAWAAASCGSGTVPPAPGPQPSQPPQSTLPPQSAAPSSGLYAKLEAVGDLALEARVQYAAHAVPPSLRVEQTWKMPAEYGYMISSQGELVRIDFEAFSVVKIKTGSKDTWLRLGKVSAGPASYIAVIDKHNPKLDSAPHTVTLAGCAYPVKFFSRACGTTRSSNQPWRLILSCLRAWKPTATPSLSG